MQPDIPDFALKYGFVTIPTGVHSGKTILIPELSLLLDSTPEGVELGELRRVAVEENALLKATATNRRDVFGTLARLYGLRPDLLLFHLLRLLWRDAGDERPLLAFLCATARDSALRVTAEVLLEKPVGEVISTAVLEGALADAFGDRYGPKSRRSMAEHLAGSWVQSGHLVGRSIKRRSRAIAGPATTTYALALGYLCGARGGLLFETFWARLLDLPTDQIDSQAFVAAQRGWLVYRRFGDIVEITFPHLLSGVNDEETSS